MSVVQNNIIANVNDFIKPDEVTNELSFTTDNFLLAKYQVNLIINNENNYGGKGLLFDLHSQQHDEGWVELGYMLNSRQLSTKTYNLKSFKNNFFNLQSNMYSNLVITPSLTRLVVTIFLFLLHGRLF